MASAIDATKPVAVNPTTASVRDNFATARDEISALQAAGPFLPLAGGSVTGPINMANNQAFACKETGGADRAMLAMGTNNQMYVGALTNVLNLNGSAIQSPSALTISASNAPLILTTPSAAYCYVQYTVSGVRQWLNGCWNDGRWIVYDNTANAPRLTIDSAGACLNTTGTWAAFSDIRLKMAETIEDYTRGLDGILGLRPKTFRYEAEPDVLHYGLIAQEVQPVMPELVSTAAKGEETYLTVDPGRAIYAVINALRELGERVTALESALAAR